LVSLSSTFGRKRNRLITWTLATGDLNNSEPPGPPDQLRIQRVANIKSQQKRNRTNERARLRNKSVKSSLRTAVRAFREAAHAGEKEKAVELLASTNRKLDKAASKGVIHKNQAANKKSALAKALNGLG
jgi:small subunit ribosomal protein S20